MNHEERLRAARTALVARFPYLYPVAYLLRPVQGKVPTMAVTERGTLYYNPQFLDTLTDTQVVGLLWHEVHHLLREHTGPRGKGIKEHPWGNIALDLEINDDAEEAGVDLPRPPHPYGGYFPQDMGLPQGLLAEEYLALLQERGDQPPPGSMDQHGPGPWEEEEEGPDEATMEVARRAVAQKAREYEAKGRGNLPGGMRRWVEEVLSPRVDWRSILRRILKGSVAHHLGRKRATYTRPHRRGHAYHPVLIPGHYGLKPRVAVVLDTSGSMHQRELAQALGEVHSILKRVGKVTLIATDATTYPPQTVRRLEEIALTGGGGTDMTQGIQRAQELGAHIAIVITDGDTPWPTQRPQITTIAVLTKGDTPDPPPYILSVRIQ